MAELLQTPESVVSCLLKLKMSFAECFCKKTLEQFGLTKSNGEQ